MRALSDRFENLQLSLRWRITLPFLLLALLLGLGATYFVLRLIQETGEERLLRQLANSGQQAADSVVAAEQDLLALERLVSNTEGVVAATLTNDAEALRTRILPLVVNAEADMVAVVDQDGTSLLAARRQPEAEAGSYETVRGEAYYADWEFVEAVLSQENPSGEKRIGLGEIQVSGRQVTALFIVGPLRSSSGRLAGAVLAGEYMGELAERISSTSGANVILYTEGTGEVMGSSFSQEQGALLPLPQDWLEEALTIEVGTPVRQIEIAGVPYREALLPFVARDGQTVLGVMGVSLLDTVQADQEAASDQASIETTRTVALIGAVGLLLIGIIGLLISHSITQPLVEIAEASKQVATGNLDIEVPERGGGEVTVVARSFNQMVRGLRQSTQGLDWGGGQLPAAEREPWKEFETVPLPEAEEATASILVIDIRTSAVTEDGAGAAMAAERAWRRADVLERIVETHRGELIYFDGYQGLASFGLPPDRQPVPVSALLASHAAVALVEELRSLDLADRLESGEGFAVTTVVHLGPVAYGDMGNRYGLSRALYGPTVKDAKDLLGAAAQRQEGGVLITEATQSALGRTRSQFIFGRKGVVSLRPPGGDMEVFEVQERQVRLLDKGSQDGS
ncbi:MAG: cache domain-containing protein [Anaerolineales bacterium]